MKVFLLIFISIILVTSISLAINHPSFGYGGGGGGGGGGSGSTLDSRVCGDKLCSEIPGGREAWESRTNTKEVEGNLAQFMDFCNEHSQIPAELKTVRQRQSVSLCWFVSANFYEKHWIWLDGENKDWTNFAQKSSEEFARSIPEFVKGGIEDTLVVNSGVSRDSFPPGMAVTIHFDYISDLGETKRFASKFTISGTLFYNELDLTNLTPNQQMKKAVLRQNVVCKINLELIFKISNGEPRCVKFSTAEKLSLRGYTDSFTIGNQGTKNTRTADNLEKIWVEIEATQCADPWYNDLISFYQDNEFDEEPNQIIKNYYEKLGVNIFDIKKDDRFQGNVFCEACNCSDGFTWLFLIPTNEIPKMLEMGFKISD